MGKGSLGGVSVPRNYWTDKHAISLTPEVVGLASLSVQQANRSPSQPKTLTGSGIEPGVSDCEATAFPRRHCTPLHSSNLQHASTNALIWPFVEKKVPLLLLTMHSS